MGRVIAVFVLAVLVIGGLVSWAGYAEFGTQQNVTFTVTGLDDQVTSSNGSIGHQYLISTVRDGGQKTEVFKDADAILHGKTDSSDVWARFQAAGAGAIWTCPVYGFRVFLFSSYRNILDGCKLLHAGGAGVGTVPNLYPTPNGKAPVTTQLTQTSP
jgi:hypothetical protein